MRSDFYSLPYAAQMAIRRGNTAKRNADHYAFTAHQLRERVTELEAALVEARGSLEAVQVLTPTIGGRESIAVETAVERIDAALGVSHD